MNHVIEMSIDPREYDLGELQGADVDGFEFPENGHVSRSADDVLRAGHYRELLLLQSRAGAGDLEKPYLDSLPGTVEAEGTAFEWLEFLVETGGFKRACEAIRQYRTLGWLTEPVERGLRDYLSGIPEAPSNETRAFESTDHLLSLIYVGRLGTA